uniref:Uncharacterized protein n=1 Tax=Calidris pygmaea TaxID=425635 RepID=A0A8C3K9I7_9CHAR
ALERIQEGKNLINDGMVIQCKEETALMLAGSLELSPQVSSLNCGMCPGACEPQQMQGEMENATWNLLGLPLSEFHISLGKSDQSLENSLFCGGYLCFAIRNLVSDL